jgi:hypothetical protein
VVSTLAEASGMSVKMCFEETDCACSSAEEYTVLCFTCVRERTRERVNI